MKKRRFFDPRFINQERRKAYVLACMLFWSVLSYLWITRYVMMSLEVIGSSMAPTLQHGDVCIVNRFIYRFREPRRGEVVAFRIPGLKDFSVKRIVALPGETIHLGNHHAQVNARDLREPYLRSSTVTTDGRMSSEECAIEPGNYFVLGDNRHASMDSRVFGPVRRDWIVGRVVVKEPRPAAETSGASNRVVRSRSRPQARTSL